MFINEWTWLFDFSFTPPTRNYLMRQYDMIGFPRNEHFSGRLFPNRSREGGREQESVGGGVMRGRWSIGNWVRHCPTAISTLMKVKWRIFLHSSASAALWLHSYYYCCCCHHGPFPVASLSFNKHKCFTYFYSPNTSNSMYIHSTYLFSEHIHLFVFEKEMSNESTEKMCRLCSRAIEHSSLMRVQTQQHTLTQPSHSLFRLLSACVYFAFQNVFFIISFIECASMILDGHSLKSICIHYVSRNECSRVLHALCAVCLFVWLIIQVIPSEKLSLLSIRD